MSAPRELSRDDVEALATGAGILGTGGSAHPYLELLSILRLYDEGRRVALLDPADLADDDLVGEVGFMGAPLITKERLPDAGQILKGFVAMQRHAGRPFRAVMSSEIGGENGVLPLLVAALAGVPAGRLVDRFGARGLGLAGLAGLAAGLLALAILPGQLGLAGYLVAIALVTAHYALFQAANNTAIMGEVRPEERGVVSGMLNLTRHLGGVTGAAVLGAVFAGVAGAADIAAAAPAAVAAGMRAAFLVALLLVLAALGIGAGGLPLRRLRPSAMVRRPPSQDGNRARR